MTRGIIKIPVLLTITLLAGCATPSQQAHLDNLHNQVNQLNSQMTQLTRQATALTLQNSLNAHSTEGAWLIPEANAPVLLDSSAGEIRLSLSQMAGDAADNRTMLTIASVAATPLPAFTVDVESGITDPTSGQPLRNTAQNQTITARPPLQPQREITLPVAINNSTPDQTGYFRIHHLVVITDAH
ncbi:DUF3251 domain-containing protein [Erwinia tracheiphila]|uniref:DUF3251 domain-containing protein n=1 Tax=Erwinia tracheiphila TaxID=65700 RepID=A0A0M2KBS1_9GAMM|nr:DUF3251 domain-containing protein [Erwinia tracheiphila]AXF74884.1 DUF3251 domain-containing protein [Erwinia tracheiphila]EOS93026.1 hypothetical protein ETR_21222 [Erwinia tracheiphila PSU-1]KKF36394.1 hypothetical protein SY86_14615 [Erwinia tracheiphila]UIA85768.1 DUF3251 domain-containing protein [Erwinia tracheiphila]UIA87730.1 DUF3251 domain-containing protein [Erwinia tracheiphila]